ncbi:MAG: pilus assembly protein PilM [Phycisphaerales bacterium JB059]
MISRSRVTPIGLDVRDGFVYAAQLLPTGRGGAARRLAAIPIDADASEGLSDEAVRTLDSILDRRGFVGSRVVIAAPREAVRSSVVSVPPGAEGEVVDAIARSDLARNHQLSPSGFELACWELPRISGAASGAGTALACACPHEAVMPLVTRLEAVGRDVVAVDLESRALARACEPRLHGADGGLRLIADLGWSSSTVLVMLGTTILYERTVGEGSLAQLRDEIGATLRVGRPSAERAIRGRGLSPLDPGASGRSARVRTMIEDYASAIADEIALSIDYAVRRHGLPDASEVLLAGPGASTPGLDEHLTHACDVPVGAVRPSDLVTLDHGAGVLDDPCVLLAIGLARATERGA